jgi:hypothetical protein
MFIVSFFFHLVVLIFRPDYVSLFDFLSFEKITGLLFLSFLLFSAFIGFIAAIEHNKNKSIQR